MPIEFKAILPNNVLSLFSPALCSVVCFACVRVGMCVCVCVCVCVCRGGGGGGNGGGGCVCKGLHVHACV